MFKLVFALLAIIATCSGQLILNNFPSADQTLIAGSSGEDVVDACIQKINSFPGISALIKNDFGFFKRIALVESNFGQNTNLVSGGIWQINPTIINNLGNISSSLDALLSAISLAFGSEFIDFSSNDFSVPLRSAIAARIFLEMQLLSNENFPGPISDQASWWVERYNSDGQTQSFITTVETFENINSCSVSTLDIWFLIDGSGSIGSSNFQQCLEFVNQTAAGFSISPDGVRTGLMIYSSSATPRSLLSQHQSNEEFSNVVLSTTYPRGGTQTGAAIDRIAEIGFNETNGARPSSQGVPRILVALTDGQSGDSVTQPSENIKNMGVTVFGVGVGQGFVVSEINEIASDPDSTYAFEFTQFDSLSSVLRDRVAAQACEVPAVIPDNTAVSLVVSSQSTVYSQVQLPSNGSVALRYEVSVTTSVAVVYLSESIANPNSAFFDASFTVQVGVTSVIYNSLATTQATTNRRKRDTTATATKPLYIAFQSRSDDPISVTFTSEPNTERVSNSGVKFRGDLGLVSTIIFTILLALFSQI